MQREIDMEQKTVNVVKGLIMDATRKANSGHPGGAMSSADAAFVLFKDFLRFDPDDPRWFNRDRFVLSAGHESMLLYSLLFLNGYLEMDDLKAFRQLGSRTPGHPEVGVTPGAEATTGPLGQGLSMAVGMAAAEAHLRARLGADLVDHCTYALVSDGDLQEPVALGSASLAGLWGLGKLIVFYDSNKIQLAGPTSRSDCASYKTVFEGFCWQVLEVDGHDRAAIRRAVQTAQLESARPTLIICHTTMAKGAVGKEGDCSTHGEPLKPEVIAATKEACGLPADASFHAPQDVLDAWRSGFGRQRERVAAWKKALAARLAADPEAAALWKLMHTPRPDLSLAFPEFKPGDKIATRAAWGKCLNAVMTQLPQLVGGSADLDPSNQTVAFRDAVGVFGADNRTGRNLAYGVREFPMAAIMNGVALHGGLIPFGATFLTFSDYCRNGIRMSALQKLPVLYVFTHDSFYVGEDGPTHQPIEHAASLALIPDLLVFRPADATETAVCLDTALRQPERPSCLLLTRQNLPVLDPAVHPAIKDGARRGGYVIKDCEGTPDLVIVATGSEVSLAIEAAALLPEKKIRVVNLCCLALFEEQPAEYKAAVLAPEVTRRVGVEAGRPDLLARYVGCEGLLIGMTRFGHSAPAGELAKKYGFTPEAVAAKIKDTF